MAKAVPLNGGHDQKYLLAPLPSATLFKTRKSPLSFLPSLPAWRAPVPGPGSSLPSSSSSSARNPIQSMASGELHLGPEFAIVVIVGLLLFPPSSLTPAPGVALIEALGRARPSLDRTMPAPPPPPTPWPAAAAAALALAANRRRKEAQNTPSAKEKRGGWRSIQIMERLSLPLPLT